MNYLDLAYRLIPEIAITVLIFAVLIVDVFFMRKQPLSVRFQTLGLLTGMGLALITLWISIKQFAPGGTQELLGGMLVIDSLTVFSKLLLMGMAIVTVLVSMNEEFTHHVSEFYALLLFALLGLLFMVMTEELVMLFVSLELASLSLYILTAFSQKTRESAEASLKYFLFGAFSSAFIYFGLTYIYGVTGITDLSGLATYLSALPKLMVSTSHILIIVGLLFILVGLGFKVAVVPFHLWAPDAYQGAPTPVTGFIATASKLASFVVLGKMLWIGFFPMEGSSAFRAWEAGWSPLLATISVLSMTLGNLAAMRQKNIKRLLAYSSISHSGYILLGLIAASHVGAVATFYYLMVYAVTNLGTFALISAVSRHIGGEDLDDFKGLAARTPLLSLFMCIFILSLASIPPLGGFFGKFYLFLALVGRDSKNFGLLWLAGAGLVNTMLSLYYYLQILKRMYIMKSDNESPILVPFYIRSALGICAIVVLLTGIFPEPLLQLIGRSISFFSV